ncbi:SIMPL domain-containing protein [Actinoplanes sp. NPDC000266]
MSQQPTIVVRGEAFREVPPEQAVISVSVSARDRDRETVVSRLLERSAELRAVLDSESGLERESGGVQVFPELKRGSERVVAYSGNVETRVTVTDFEALGALLLRLAGLEFASVSGPWWQLRPGSKAGGDVRREAIADALARAREYAAAVGARIDRLVEIADEGVGGGPMMMRAEAAGFDMARDAGGGFELDPQRQTVQAAVTVRVTITEPDLSA